ncbi:hypothetical protein GCM10023185_19550 [Hymenobacter saemangeumensis]|uniref:Carboxypeptidase-like regulatory domain-containing protein n=1 Tax=Hymenobacter saemangeumensis TaxID=1084522 RepID=A0ABP8ID51_9BACT
MSNENLPTDNESYDPNLEAEDEELSSGNNRLALILGGIMLLLVVGYLLLPKGKGDGLEGMTPTFMLDDAAVTATAPTSEDSIAAGLKAAPLATATAAAATTTRTEQPAAEGTPTAAAPASTQAASAPAASPVAAAASPEPAAEAPAPAAAPEPAAAANVTLTGRIADENGRPLVGATVMLRGSSKVTSTDANGNYSIDVPNSDNTLVYGYGGYNDEEVRTRGNQPVNVSLTPNPNSGKRKRR